MTPDNDGLLEPEPITIEDETMASIPAEIHEQNLSRIAGAGAMAHEHNQSYNKILDLAYVQERNMVSLTEALGVREVTSKSGQIGIPIAGAGQG